MTSCADRLFQTLCLALPYPENLLSYPCEGILKAHRPGPHMAWTCEQQARLQPSCSKPTKLYRQGDLARV